MPVAETQAGKGALAWDHPLQQGAIGVTGSPAANALAHEADVVLAIGTRLQDFTTGSHTLATQATAGESQRECLRRAEVARRRGACRCEIGTRTRSRSALGGWKSVPEWEARSKSAADDWRRTVDRITGARDVELPYEGDVIGAVQRSSPDSAARDIVVCAAGTLPAELHKLWRTVAARRLSRRVRLLVHGLRDRRRARRENGAGPSAR